MPITRGWFAAPAVKAITIWPLLLAVAVKFSTRAASFPDRRVDVEVGEHGCAVDGHVEFAAACGGEVSFGEVQQDGVMAPAVRPGIV